MPRVIHFEIHAENPQRAIDFYTQVFGWSFRKWDGPIEYWMIDTGPDDKEGINGGLVKRMGASPVGGEPVNAYVCTVDVAPLDEYVVKAVQAGGVIAHPKFPIPGVGWLAHVKDTEGNILGIMENDPNAT